MKNIEFGTNMWNEIWLRCGNDIVYPVREGEKAYLHQGNACSGLISFMGRIKWGITPAKEIRDLYLEAYHYYFGE